MIRGLGYIKSLKDLDQTAVGVYRNGTPILIKDIGSAQYGPEIRRGIAEWDGQGETVGGIVVVRYGAARFSGLPVRSGTMGAGFVYNAGTADGTWRNERDEGKREGHRRAE